MEDLSRGAVLLLVDSLDELSSNEERRYVLETINSFGARYPKIRVVITSRPYRFTSELVELQGYEEYRISPINWTQAAKIYQRIQRGKHIPVSKANEALRQLEQIHGLELNPLLVTVFAAASDVSQQDIPANITELFKKFTELMLRRWDERKGMRHQYQAPLKDHVVMRIAYSLHQRKTKSVTRQEAEQLVDDVLRVMGHAAEGEQLLGEILDRSGLFRVIGENVEFRHHLLQEFFAGRAIPNADHVNHVVTDEWWGRALVFYFGENPSRIDILKGAMIQASDTVGPVQDASGECNRACYSGMLSVAGD